MSALHHVASLAVPPSILKHRFVREAWACTRLVEKKNDARRQVVGTANTRQCELYGWRRHVDAHIDCTGYVYLMALDFGRSLVCAWDEHLPDEEQISELQLMRGTVLRLNDHILHWTVDQSPRVAMFIGSWQWPDDDQALRCLQVGLDALARGDYYGAPRVQAGFRVLLEDECLVAGEKLEEPEPMLISDAQQQGRLILTCSRCEAKAVKIDDKWPYFSDHNRCRAHLAADSDGGDEPCTSDDSQQPQPWPCCSPGPRPR